jgi:hypothetical protein
VVLPGSRVFVQRHENALANFLQTGVRCVQ